MHANCHIFITCTVMAIMAKDYKKNGSIQIMVARYRLSLYRHGANKINHMGILVKNFGQVLLVPDYPT